MSAHSYPISLGEIADWARAHKTNLHEANTRFMEFVILSCVAANQLLRHKMVLKGGNGLRFAYQSPRSTKDLDFSVENSADLSDNKDQLREVLDRALAPTERKFGVKAKCQRVRRNPASPDATRPTYDVAVGYQFPNDRYFRNFEGRDVSTVIPLEISFFDLVCGTAPLSLRGEKASQMQVGTLEDIIAEKLRSLLQQPIRNRNRPQDVYDIARYHRVSGADLDSAKISDYLKRKSAIRNVTVGKSAFDSTVRDMAAIDYDQHIQDQAGQHFISFDHAWREVLLLVERLDIPD